MYYITRYESGNVYLEQSIVNTDRTIVINILSVKQPNSVSYVGKCSVLYASAVILQSEDKEKLLEQALLEIV